MNTQNNICPYCMSILKYDENNNLVCTGNMLKLLIPEFEIFKKLNYRKKKDYLKNIENVEFFVELFNKWLMDKLECEYSNSVFYQNCICEYYNNLVGYEE